MKKNIPFTTFFTLSILCAVTGIALSSTYFSSNFNYQTVNRKVSVLRIILIVQLFASVLGSSVLKKRRNPVFFVFLSLLTSLVVTVYSGLMAISLDDANLLPDFIIPLFSLVVLIFGIIGVVSYFVRKDASESDYVSPDSFAKRKDTDSFSGPSANSKVIETNGLTKTCTQCGAKTDISQNGKYSHCPYCGTFYKVKDKDEFFD